MKKSTLNFAKILILSPLIIISGCGDNEKIGNLKKHVFNYVDDTISLGNALDSKEICKSTRWNEYTDDRNRNVISYTCDLQNFSNIFENFIDLDIEYYKNETGKIIDKNNNAIEINNSRIEQWKKLVSALNKIRNNNIDKEYNDVSKKLYVNTHDYRFIFNKSHGYSVNQYYDKELQNKMINLESKIRDIIIDSGVLQDFYYDLGLSRSYTEDIDYLKISESEMESIFKGKVESYSEAINESKKIINEQENSLKEREDFLSKTKNKMLPKYITQTIVFSTDNIDPKPIECGFKFILANKKEIKFTPNNCFNMSYSSEYERSYMNMFNIIFRKYINN